MAPDPPLPPDGQQLYNEHAAPWFEAELGDPQDQQESLNDSHDKQK